MSDDSIVVSEELAQAYSKAKRVSMEEAYKRLKENFTKEAEQVDLRQQYGVLIKAFRNMAPQLNGVVLREADVIAKVKSVEAELAGVRAQLRIMNEKLVPFYVKLWNRIKCLLKL